MRVSPLLIQTCWSGLCGCAPSSPVSLVLFTPWHHTYCSSSCESFSSSVTDTLVRVVCLCSSQSSVPLYPMSPYLLQLFMWEFLLLCSFQLRIPSPIYPMAPYLLQLLLWEFLLLCDRHAGQGCVFVLLPVQCPFIPHVTILTAALHVRVSPPLWRTHWWGPHPAVLLPIWWFLTWTVLYTYNLYSCGIMFTEIRVNTESLHKGAR